jgi:hypothetical protein
MEEKWKIKDKKQKNLKARQQSDGERKTTGRRAPSQKLDNKDDEVPMPHQIEKIQCANSADK